MLVVFHFFFSLSFLILLGLDVKTGLEIGVWKSKTNMLSSDSDGRDQGRSWNGWNDTNALGPHWVQFCPRQAQPQTIRAFEGIGKGLTLMKSGRQDNPGSPAHFLLLSTLLSLLPFKPIFHSVSVWKCSPF